MNTPVKKTNGHYHYIVTCPRCGNTKEVRVPTGLLRSWRCPITPLCEQWFQQNPQQYGRKPYVTPTETPGQRSKKSIRSFD